MYYVEKNKLTANVGARPMLYHIRKYFNDLAGNWPGPSACPVEIVDEDPAGGDWTAELNVGDTAFIVIGSTMVWPGTTKKWQAIIAATSSGAMIGSLTPVPAGPGLYVALSPDGGWDSAAQDFGNLASNEMPWTELKSIKGNNTGTDLGIARMNIAVCERIPSGGSVDQCCVIMYGDNLDDGTYDIGCYLGAINCFEDEVTNPHPCIMITGRPQWGSGNTAYWGYWSGGQNGLAPNAADTGWTKAAMDPDNEPNWNTGKLLTQRAGTEAGFKNLIHDFVANRVIGWPVEVFRVDAATVDGTTNAAGDRIAYGGLSLPYV